MNKKKKIADSLEEVIAAANTAYDKHKEEYPHLFHENERVYFVNGWLKRRYECLYEIVNSR